MTETDRDTQGQPGHIRLGVNIDHVATLRQARGTAYPSPVEAARICEAAGADGITAHLREDRRHIQDADIAAIQAAVSIPLNLEMAVSEEMLAIAEARRPPHCCLVPEKREELTTEGGLDVAGNLDRIAQACERLAAAGVRVSLFIDPEPAQLEAALRVGAPACEIHTGHYANLVGAAREQELQRIRRFARDAHGAGLEVHAGHGLTYDNVAPIAALPELVELNIGHFLIAQAVFDGLPAVVIEMQRRMRQARGVQ